MALAGARGAVSDISDQVRAARAVSKLGSTTADFPRRPRSRGDRCTCCTIRDTATHHPPGGRCCPTPGFGLDHAAVGRASRRQRGVHSQKRDASLAGRGGHGQRTQKGFVGDSSWAVGDGLDDHGQRFARSRMGLSPMPWRGRLRAVVGAERPGASRHVARGRPRSQRR